MATVSICRLPGCGRPLEDGLLLFCGWHWHDLSPKQRIDYLELAARCEEQPEWYIAELERAEARLIRHLQRKYLR